MISFTFNLSTTPSFNIIVLFNHNPYELTTIKEGELAFYIEWRQQQLQFLC